MLNDTRLPWEYPEWLAEAHTWITNVLDTRDVRVIGTIEQPHVRAWSTVLRVPTDAGTMFFKATAPSLAHEPALTAALARWMPTYILEVIAVDEARAWMLLPDGGSTLRTVIQADRDLRYWERALPHYAELQIALTGRGNDLLRLGAFDRRPVTLPEHLARILADTPALLIDHPDGMTSEDYRQLQALGPRVAELAEQLAAYGIPETLHHDDFHDGNIFTQNGTYRFFDWGESCLAHPFFTLVVGLRGIAYRFELEPGSLEIERLRDAYLEPWTRYAPRPQLHEAARIAQPLGALCRALTWYHVVSALAEPHRSAEADAPPGWLLEFLVAMQSVAPASETRRSSPG